MKCVHSFMAMSVLALAATTASAFAQAAPAQDKPKPAGEQKAPEAKGKAIVVFLGNATCPADAKPVNRDKFVEVEGQRVYVCSDECVATLKKDPAAAKAALAKAYPKETEVPSKTCVCSAPIEAGKGTAVSYQGHKITCCSPDCAATVKKSPVTAIVLLMHPDVKDVKNTSDPIDDKPIDATIVGVYKTHLIHFSSWANAAAFEKDPSATISKLKLSS